MKVCKHNGLILIIILSLLVLSMNCSYTYASSLGDVINGADSFIEAGKGDEKINSGSLKSLSNTIYYVLLVIGIAIAMIVGVVLGIQFMVGSVEQKSKVKESLIPYFAGCVVVFGAFGIWKLVVTILSQV